MDWLNLWVNTFMKRLKAKYTFEDGIKSVVYSSVIIGMLSFLSGLMISTEGAAYSFVINVIVLPIVALIAMFIFAAVFRWIAGMDGGKGSFKKDSAAIGLYAGSTIFIAGLVMLALGLVMTVTNAAGFVLFLLVVLMIASLLYLSVITFGLWLEELALAEKLSLFSTAKVFGLATALIVLVLCLLSGAMVGFTPTSPVIG